jgi:hypothetical protein
MRNGVLSVPVLLAALFAMPVASANGQDVVVAIQFHQYAFLDNIDCCDNRLGDPEIDLTDDGTTLHTCNTDNDKENGDCNSILTVTLDGGVDSVVVQFFDRDTFGRDSVDISNDGNDGVTITINANANPKTWSTQDGNPDCDGVGFGSQCELVQNTDQDQDEGSLFVSIDLSEARLLLT